MKTTALIAAALLAGSAAAMAATDTVRTDDATRAEQKDHRTAGQKLRGAMHRLGDKTRHAFHRDRSDTTAMGAAGADARQQRMDDAYANWKEKQDKQEKSR